jgi:hypothetical protein
MPIIESFVAGTMYKGMQNIKYKKRHGLFARDLLKFKLNEIIAEYDRNGCVTDRMVDLLGHEGDDEELSHIAQVAGLLPTGLAGLAIYAIKASTQKDYSDQHPLEDFLMGDAHDLVLNYKYYWEEESTKISDDELRHFIGLARKALLTLI